ncbi:hypothetical protein AQUCO_01200226v1 [Aquilegia coerulea]|uniref:Cytochrome P450 n=1 Tax=Aquilegia coerulea TaxID=218851 RepID=A0A2G5E5J1_AQUCA|nr:hypothetical protein AQUCO_20000001v1 [Aquilegia coerulea]PIA50817.1 hypothetical protein AQUCO_01200226v1 [Aquilegia coerulea]
MSKALSWCLETSKDEYRAVLILSLLLIVITWWILKIRSRKEKASLPPGPWGLPIIGNLPFLDPQLHRYFDKLSIKYGPILKVQLGSKLAMVLNSPEIAKEVLKDHDANFADRDVPAAGFVASYGALDIVYAPYGDHWRMMRKVCVRELLSPGRLKALYTVRGREVQEMVNKVHSKIGQSIDIGEHVFLGMFNILTSMMWGNTLEGVERVRVTTNYRKVAKKLVALSAEANISDLFPVLARFDLQGKERRMKEILGWFDQIYEFVINKRRKMESQQDPESKHKDIENQDFLDVLLQLIDQGGQKTQLTITHIKALFLDITLAGTKSTSSTVEWALTELLKQPEIMKRAQEELDQVVGLNNRVEEIHLSKLPYLDAIVKEVFRLYPTAALLIPRVPRESCIIGGYLIPRGSKIFVNVWAMQRDPKYWSDPLEFRPERFLNSTNDWNYDGNDFRYLPFGSGRRICVGIPIAEKMVSYLLASLLHSFNWELPQGTKLDLAEEFGFVLSKKIPLLAVPSPRLLDYKLYD